MIIEEINMIILINKTEIQSNNTKNSILIEFKLNNNHSIIIPVPKKYIIKLATKNIKNIIIIKNE